VSSGSPAVAIVTDSTCDIPPAIAESLGIRVVPALLTLDGTTFEDGLGLTRSEFYRRLPSLARPAQTASPSPHAFQSTYDSAFSAGAQSVVSIHASSRLSGIFNAASHAAKAFGDRVVALDGQHVSMALGFQAVVAAEAPRDGAPFEAVVRLAEKAREAVRLVAMIDTLEYLKRSGRVTWVRAGLGDLLRVKLLIAVVDGLVKRIDHIRTKARALERLHSIARSWGASDRLAILHSGVPQEAQALGERLRELTPLPPVFADVTPLIGAHVGPGSLGLAALLAQG